MQTAMQDLELSRLYVVHPGKARYALGDRVEAIGLAELLRELGARGRKAPISRRPSR